MPIDPALTIRYSPTRVYHAHQLTGDPATGGAPVAEEWAIPGSNTARRENADTIVTRDSVPCQDSDPAGPACDEVRWRTLDSQIEGAEADWLDNFITHRGTSVDDPALDQIADLLLPATFAPGHTPVATGSLSSVVESWQEPPPGHGGTYELYEITEPRNYNTGEPDPATGEFPEGTQTGNVVYQIWVEAETRLPIRQDHGMGSESGSLYWTYDPATTTRQDHPPDFFLVSPPEEPGMNQSVTYLAEPPASEVRDRGTGTMFAAYTVGPALTIMGQELCLAQTILFDHREHMPNDGTVSADNGSRRDFSEMTRLDAVYQPRRIGTKCGEKQTVPGSMGALTVTTVARTSELAYAYREIVMATGRKVKTSNGAPNAFGGASPVDPATTAEQVHAAPSTTGGTLALVDTGDSTVLIQGDFTSAVVDSLVKQLETP